MVMVGREGILWTFTWAAPMAITGRAFSALVKDIFALLGETFAVFVVKRRMHTQNTWILTKYLKG
jgi:hypothetical protein